MKYYIISLVFAHFLGDWIFQSRKMAMNKSKHVSTLLLHGLIISICLFVVSCCYNSLFDSFLSTIINGIVHCILDWFGWSFYKNKFKNLSLEQHFSNYWFYTNIAIDQFLHILIILILFV